MEVDLGVDKAVDISDKAETSLRHRVRSVHMPTYVTNHIVPCQRADLRDLRDFEGELSILYVLFQENKVKPERAITSVQCHIVFTFEQDWILKDPSELFNPLAGVILIVFKIIAFGALIELMLSWSSDTNWPRGSVASWSYSLQVGCQIVVSS